jgi:hypothetical protein
MYLFNLQQWKWIITCLCVLLLVATLFSVSPSFLIKFILVGAAVFAMLSVWFSGLVGKRTSVLLLFLISVFVSFSHFLLGFSKDTALVAVVYSFSILTLFTLLVTNFKENNLINN